MTFAMTTLRMLLVTTRDSLLEAHYEQLLLPANHFLITT